VRHHKHVSYQEFTSTHGHDSFLLDVPAYRRTVKAFLDRRGECL
jgi:homoserine acetyltransferase